MPFWEGLLLPGALWSPDHLQSLSWILLESDLSSSGEGARECSCDISLYTYKQCQPEGRGCGVASAVAQLQSEGGTSGCPVSDSPMGERDSSVHTLERPPRGQCRAANWLGSVESLEAECCCHQAPSLFPESGVDTPSPSPHIKGQVGDETE